MSVPDPAMSRPVKPRCDVCGQRMPAGQACCLSWLLSVRDSSWRTRAKG